MRFRDTWVERRLTRARPLAGPGAGRARQATSAPFLLDSEGVLRFVHPGPLYAPLAQAGHPGGPDDLIQLRVAVTALLGEPDGAQD